MVSLPLLLFTKCNPLGPPGTRWRLLLSGLLTCFLVLTLHLAVTRAPVSVVTCIMLLTPVTTNIVSGMILGNRITQVLLYSKYLEYLNEHKDLFAHLFLFLIE